MKMVLTILLLSANLFAHDWNPLRSELFVTIVWYLDGIDDVAAATLWPTHKIHKLLSVHSFYLHLPRLISPVYKEKFKFHEISYFLTYSLHLRNSCRLGFLYQFHHKSPNIYIVYFVWFPLLSLPFYVKLHRNPLFIPQLALLWWFVIFTYFMQYMAAGIFPPAPFWGHNLKGSVCYWSVQAVPRRYKKKVQTTTRMKQPYDHMPTKRVLPMSIGATSTLSLM